MNSTKMPLFTVGNGIVTCNLCFHHCTLREGAVGFCGVNTNRNGKLMSLVYEHPSALQIDPIEKKPLYHFHPDTSILSIGTVGCNFRCPFCQNASLSMRKADTESVTISSEEIIRKVEDTCGALAFTYNEPTVSWLWFRDLATVAKEKAISTVMVTNGAMSEAVCDDMAGKIDAVNVDLKCGTDSHYKKTLHGDRSAVISNLKRLKENGIWIELTTLLVPRISDSHDDLALSGQEIMNLLGPSVPWHISAYRPAYHYSQKATPASLVLERCEQLREMGFYYVYPGNIAAESNTYCPDCSTLLIERTGYTTNNKMKSNNCPHCNRVIEGSFL